jgi:hypothetical protein
MFNNFFPKIEMRYMEKYGRGRQTTDGNIIGACALHVG